MNMLKKSLAVAALALVIALPAQAAEQDTRAGMGQCAVQLATCLATGGGAVCAIQFVQCLVTGGKTAARRD